MKGFFSFVRKETLHILRDRRTMLIVLLMPVVQLLLFGFAISVEVNNIDFAVVASHPTEAVRRQVERIAANPYFTFGGYIRQDEADEVLRTGEVGAVVVFAADYDRRTAGSGEPDGAAIQLIFDASNPNDASSGAGYLRSVLLAEGTGGAPTPELHLLYNPQMKSSYNFVPGLMGLIFMLICAMMTSVSIVREKETGTMEVLLVSPVRPLRIVVAKMIPYFLLSCVNLATILLLARFVLGVPMSGSVVGLVGLSLLYLVLALALGLFISTMADAAVAMLKQLARRYDMPVIAASSLNREAYRPGSAEPGMSAFKESGSVEYSADLLLVLKYRTDADKEIKTGPRHLVLTILKNRFGATGESIPLDYEPEKELFRDGAAKATPRTGRNKIR